MKRNMLTIVLILSAILFSNVGLGQNNDDLYKKERTSKPKVNKQPVEEEYYNTNPQITNLDSIDYYPGMLTEMLQQRYPDTEIKEIEVGDLPDNQIIINLDRVPNWAQPYYTNVLYGYYPSYFNWVDYVYGPYYRPFANVYKGYRPWYSYNDPWFNPWGGFYGGFYGGYYGGFYGGYGNYYGGYYPGFHPGYYPGYYPGNYYPGGHHPNHSHAKPGSVVRNNDLRRSGSSSSSVYTNKIKSDRVNSNYSSSYNPTNRPSNATKNNTTNRTNTNNGKYTNSVRNYNQGTTSTRRSTGSSGSVVRTNTNTTTRRR